MFVLSTAGHVDHGKSSLLKVLTGLEPDRLPEEKKRGMTIDLGFVWMDSPKGRIGIVDVPGHQKFVKNLVTGILSTDAFIFVVAADDGWMPQSEEHLQVLSTLGITHGIAVVTKIDLVAKERVQEVKSDVAARFFMALQREIQIVEFSSVSLEGKLGLQNAVNDLIRGLPQPDGLSSCRLWIDRAFTPKGLGVVVTGTLREAALAAGDDLQLWPLSEYASAKSLQAYHTSVARVEPVARVAVQLGQLELKEVARGMLLTHVPSFVSDQSDVRLKYLSAPIKQNLRAKFYIGTLEEPCILIPVEKEMSSLVRIKFRRPIPLRSGDRFLIRLTGEERTLAGGVVLDPLARSRSHKRIRENLQKVDGSLESALQMEFELSGAVNISELTRRTLFPKNVIENALNKPAYQELSGSYFLKSFLEEGLRKIAEVLQKAKAPVSLSALGNAVGEKIKTHLPLFLKSGEEEGRWDQERGVWCLRNQAAPTAEKPVIAFLERSLLPLNLTELTAASFPKDEIYRLAREKKMVALGDGYFLSQSRYLLYQRQVREFIAAKGQATTPDLKGVLGGLSRKYALLILEQMDRDRVTYLRDGVRRLLTSG